uniref:LNS2 domain-containing protein n=1 Tax=Globodera pallida TaxID=36090 RepID=A0A183BIK5_GLOPA
MSGAIDVIVVEQPDGSLASTPFHVRFGKYGVFNYDNKYVDIEINGEEIDLKMKLGENGVAFFLENEDESFGETKAAEEKQFPRELSNNLCDDDARNRSIEAQNQRKHSFASSCSSTSSFTSQQPPCATTTATVAAADRKMSTPPKRSKMMPPFVNHKASVQQNRQRLPFSSSIYSCRRNRSLPDLTNLLSSSSNISDGIGTEQPPEGKGQRKVTMGGRVDGLRRMDETGANNTLKHSSSASVPLKNYYRQDSKIAHFSSAISNSAREKDASETDEGRREADGPKSCAPSTSELADGALSDSEVDRHRSIKDPEWKWGEIPKSNANVSDKADANGSRKKSRWDYWFGRWSRRSKEEKDKCVGSAGEKGLFLEDIGNDPAKFGMYIGKNKTEALCISSKSSDSGNGPSLGTSPTMSCSPVLSEENLASEFAKGNATDRRPSNLMDMELFEDKAKEKRSLRLSADQLDLLNLNYGSNDARFSITTKYQGTAWCSCHIYLLKWSDKLVISDIDGTITKSDVLGHVIPAIGGTWAHSGVAELYTGIKKNGYQMVYLSSRAIGQSHYTKTYLQNFAQGSRMLPDGPVLLSPSSVLMAFRKEVIERKPEEFKIACLTDLKSLFSVGQPFFAGFGNRETDAKSYRAVGVPPERILIIDPQGSLRRADNKAGGYVSDYASLAMNSVDYVFPPRVEKDGVCLESEDTLSEFVVWRNDAEQFDALVDAELELYEDRRKRAKATVVGTAEGRGADGKKKKYSNGRRTR